MIELGGHFPFPRRIGLDGLRGILAMLVVFFHLKIPFFIQGYSGVDGFFVLSGFVITSIIIREVFEKKELDFYHFYARRSKRLLPASLAVILISCIGYRLVVSDYLIKRNGGSFIAACTFWENFYLISNAKDYFGPNTQESPLMHYWSLAVEEQFYIVYPAILYFLLKCTGFQVKKIIALMSVGIGGLLVYQFFFTEDLLESEIYFGTQFRIYQLFSGAIIGLILFQYEMDRRDGKGNLLVLSQSTTRALGSILSLIGLGATFLLATPYYRSNSSEIGLLSTICTVILIVGMECSEDDITNRILGHPFFQFLGKHSYSIYLWHYPLIIIGKLMQFRTTNGRFSSEIEIIVLLLVLSYITWIFIERPVKFITIPDKQIVICAILAIIITFVAVSLITTLPDENKDHDIFPNPLLVDSVLEPAIEPSNVPDTPTIPIAPISVIPVVAVSAPVVPVADVDTVVKKIKDADYYFHGDSFASEWKFILPIIFERRNLSITIHRQLDCPWMGGTFVFFERIGRGEPDLFYGPQKPTDCSGQSNNWGQMFAHKNRAKVVFVATFSVLKHYIRLPDRSKLYPGEPGWAQEIEKEIRLRVEPEWETNPNIQFVCIEPHYTQSAELFSCNAHNAIKSNCFDYPAEWWPFQELFISIYYKLHEEYGDKFQVISINDIVCPNDLCSLEEGDHKRIFNDEIHLTSDFFDRHLEDFDTILAPFLHE